MCAEPPSTNKQAAEHKELKKKIKHEKTINNQKQ
jgi:hypothetical protein